MKRLTALLLLLIITVYGCTSNLNKQVDELNARIDSLETNHFPNDLNADDKRNKYYWFNLGELGFQIVS